MTIEIMGATLDARWVFPLLALATLAMFVSGVTSRRASVDPGWWLAVIVGGGLAFGKGHVTAASSGGIDFVLPLLLGLWFGGRVSHSRQGRINGPALEIVGFVIATVVVAILSSSGGICFGGRVVGHWNDPNVTALFLLAPIVWGMSLACNIVTSHRVRWLLPVLPGLIALFVLLLGTASRAGVLSAGLAIWWYVSRRSRSIKAYLVPGGVVVLAAALAILIYQPFHNRVNEMVMGVDLAIRHRWIQVEALVGLMSAKPVFGVGWEELSHVWPDYLRPSNMHTRYGGAPWLLEIGCQVGVVWLWLLLALVLFAIARTPRSRVRRIGAASLVGLVIGGLSQSFVAFPIINAIFFFVFGVALSPNKVSESRGLLKALAVAGVVTTGLFVVGLSRLPSTSWREYPEGTVVVQPRGEAEWVLLDCRPIPRGGSGSRAFYRQIAEAGAIYFRIGCLTDPRTETAKATAKRLSLPIMLVLDDRSDIDAHWCSGVHMDSLVRIRRADPGEPFGLSRVSESTLLPDCRREWRILAPVRGPFVLPRDRFVATSIVQLFKNVETKRGLWKEDVVRPKEVLSSLANLERHDRSAVLEMLESRHPYANHRTLKQEAVLAWKVRDRFYRDVPANLYARSVVVGSPEVCPGWRKRFFFHYYPLVWGTPSEAEGVRRITDDALWRAIVREAPHPWVRPIRSLDDLAAYTVLACRSVGIAAKTEDCREHAACVRYYDDNGEAWKCEELGQRWRILTDVIESSAPSSAVEALR